MALAGPDNLRRRETPQHFRAAVNLAAVQLTSFGLPTGQLAKGRNIQGQRTLTPGSRKDFRHEVGAPSGHLLFSFDAVLGGVLLQEADRHAA